MDINKNLENKISEFPEDLQELAKILLSAIDNDKTKSEISIIIQDEIRGLVSKEI
jgi:hypothetical protein